MCSRTLGEEREGLQLFLVVFFGIQKEISFFKNIFPLSKKKKKKIKGLPPVPFSYTNCGDPKTDPVLIKKMTVDPFPIVQGKNVTASLDMDVAVNIQNVKVVILMQKQTTSSWVKIPCVDDIGSCTYANFCEYLEKIPPEKCPPFLGFPCRCPIKAGNYKYTNLDFGPVPDVGSIGVGNYKVTVTGTFNDSGKPVACYQFLFSLAK